MFNLEKAYDISVRIVTCQLLTALIQSSPKIASYFEPSDIMNIQSLYSLASSSFYASHASAIDAIDHFHNDFSLYVIRYTEWEECWGKLAIDVKFFLFNYFIKNNHTMNNILYHIY